MHACSLGNDAEQPQIPPKHMPASRKILIANQNTFKAITFRHGLQSTNGAQSLSSQIHHDITEFKLSTHHILFQQMIKTDDRHHMDLNICLINIIDLSLSLLQSSSIILYPG